MKPLFTITLVVLALIAHAQTKKEAKEAELNQARYAAWDCESITNTAMRLRCVGDKVNHDRAQQQKEQARRDSAAKANRDSVYAARPTTKLVESQSEELPESSFISAYGGGRIGLSEVRSTSSNRYLTPITYVDFNHVYDQINEYMRYVMHWTEVSAPVYSDQSFVSTYRAAKGKVKITYEVGSYEDHFYVKSLRITGDSPYLEQFFLTYWPHGFNEQNVRSGELAAYTYLMDHVSFSNEGIRVDNPSIKNHQDFVNRVSK